MWSINDVKKALEDVDAVIHLAAVVGDLPGQVAPKSAYQINFQGTQLLVDYAKKWNLKIYICFNML